VGSWALLPLNGIFLVLSLAILVVKVFALVDCIRAPERAFVAAGKQTKQFWTILLAVAVLVTFVGFLAVLGLVAAIVYLVDVRPAVHGGTSSYDRW
jgi:Protein of unknown function (DUF2516)